jgi:hypothetical protein
LATTYGRDEKKRPNMPEQLRVGVIGASWDCDLRRIPIM